MQAFRKAAEVAAAEAAQQRVVIPSANAAEVARVLAARSHLECLQLPQSPSKEALKRKYRTMAVSLHPDKCKVSMTYSTIRWAAHGHVMAYSI